jgi:hypothetical protein
VADDRPRPIKLQGSNCVSCWDVAFQVTCGVGCQWTMISLMNGWLESGG